MDDFKEIVRNICMIVLRNVLKVFFVFPIKKNRVIFESYLGKQYSCNPKYISEELRKQSNNYEIIWAFEKPEEYNDLKKMGIKVVPASGPIFLFYRLTSMVTVTNVMWRNYIPIRKKQYEIQTWHGGGGGYKKTLADDKEQQRKKITLKRHLKNFERYSLVLTSSTTSLRTNVRMAMCYKGIVMGGTPRNDILMKNLNNRNLNIKVREYFGIENSKKIVLYAPTWRKGACKKDFDIDYSLLKTALKHRFGGEWVVLSRMHWLAAQCFIEKPKEAIIADSYPDMQELLYVVDVLISDYSSSIWDFSFTAKPCFLFCTDLDKFIEERDFYNPIATWGFPVAQNNEELVDKIEGFNESEYCKAMEEQHVKNGSFENGHAAENVCKIIYAMCYGDQTLPEGLPYKYCGK